jgi:hypothetical protein
MRAALLIYSSSTTFFGPGPLSTGTASPEIVFDLLPAVIGLTGLPLLLIGLFKSLT